MHSVLLTLHHTPKRIQYCLASEVLRGDEVDEVLLAPFFLAIVRIGALSR